MSTYPHARRVRAACFARTLLLTAAGALSIHGHAAAQVPLILVAQTGNPAPGIDGAVLQLLDYSPMLNERGDLVFRGMIGGSVVAPTEAQAIWRWTDGVSRLIVRSGTPTSNHPETVLGSLGLSAPLLDGHGAVVFRAGVRASEGTWTVAVFSASDTDLTSWARHGTTVPGVDEAIYSGSFPQPLTRGGRHLLVAGLAAGPTANNTALVLVQDGVFPRLVAFSGTTAPGSNGQIFRSVVSFAAPNYTMNAHGEVAFGAWLGSANPAGDFGGIWKSTPTGETSAVVVQGMPVPSIDGATFRQFSTPYVDDFGAVGFRAKIEGPGVTSSNDQTLWRVDPVNGISRLIARTGEPVPGIDGATFASFVLHQAGPGGHAVFTARVTPDSGSPVVTGIWRYDPNAFGAESITLVVREGDAWPGAGPTYKFGQVLPSDLAINGRGQVAFFMGSPSAWFATDRLGRLRIAIRGSATLIETTDGLVRFINSVRSPYDQSMRGQMNALFNSRGDLGVRAAVGPFGEAVFLARITCPGDFDGSGTVEPADLYEFLDRYFAGSPRADVDLTRTNTVQDVLQFVGDYLTPCPE